MLGDVDRCDITIDLAAHIRMLERNKAGGFTVLTDGIEFALRGIC